MNDSVKRGIARLMARRERVEAVGKQMELERHRFDALRESDGPRVVQSFNLFETPVALADELVLILQNMLGSLDGLRILEPSAGTGRLYQAIRNRTDAPVTLVDVSAECCRELYHQTAGDEVASLIHADFLECDVERLGGPFDVVLMNPPFKRGSDLKHIRHAGAMLRPGGVLLALCADGPRQRQQLQAAPYQYTPLPPNTFREAGTRVATARVTYIR